VAKIDPLRLGLGQLFSPRPAGRRGRPGQPATSDADSSPVEAGLPTHILPLADEINASGAELAGDPTGGALERYRRAVGRFLDAATTDSMQVTSESTLGLASRVFATVTRSNLLLGELADAVLGRQRDVVKVRTLIDQIKGLLIDLYR
jgi:uncharacterized protein YaaR (DUF327 family)